jgi:hypothetical protein
MCRIMTVQKYICDYMLMLILRIKKGQNQLRSIMFYAYTVIIGSICDLANLYD